MQIAPFTTCGRLSAPNNGNMKTIRLIRKKVSRKPRNSLGLKLKTSIRLHEAKSEPDCLALVSNGLCAAREINVIFLNSAENGIDP